MAYLRSLSGSDTVAGQLILTLAIALPSACGGGSFGETGTAGDAGGSGEGGSGGGQGGSTGKGGSGFVPETAGGCFTDYCIRAHVCGL
jgi:hypothetical protein